MERIIVKESWKDGKHFFTTDHCQEGYDDYTPTTFNIPMNVTPRPSLPSGEVKTKQDIITIFLDDSVEIPNPDPNYQPI